MTRILISQPRPQTAKSPYFDVADKYNLELVFRPFIKIEPMASIDFRSQHVHIPGHTAIVFTSRHAIDHFFNMCKELRITMPVETKYFSISEQVSLYLQKYVPYRKRKNFFTESGKLADLLPFIQKYDKEIYFAPLSSAHNDDMYNLLEEAGVEHDEAVMYYTVPNDFKPGEKLDYNMLVFFSPEGIHSLIRNFPDFEQADICIACLGSKTIHEAEKAGLRVDLTPTAELRSVPAMIEEFAKRRLK